MVEYWRRARRALVLSLVTLSMAIPAMGSAAVLQLSVDDVSYGITDVAAVEFAFREMINEERVAQGFGTLASFDDLIDDARTQAVDMSEAGYLYHNPDLADVSVGELVQVGRERRLRSGSRHPPSGVHGFAGARSQPPQGCLQLCRRWGDH